jgi:pimeloyl-ACP methyl ester carboxylesterase
VPKDLVADLIAAGKSPPDIVSVIAAEAEVFETPCGDGRMVWRQFGSGPPVVLAHGGSGSWTHWIKTIPALRDRYELWVPDLPGLGDSDMPHHPHTPESCGKALALGISALIPRERRPHVAAFSFGVHVSTFAVLELQERVASFIVSGSAGLGLRQGPGIELPREEPGMTGSEKLDVHRRLLEVLMISNPARIDELAIHLQAENVRQARFRSRPFARTDEVRRRLPEVRVPLRAIWGANDSTSLPSLEVRYDALREGHPELQTRTIADAGHWVMYEQAAAYNAALVEMLEA